MRRLNRALLGKLTQLPPGECPELLRGQASLVHAQVLVWTRARGRLVAPASKSCAFDRWSQEPGATAVEPVLRDPDWRVKKFAELGPMKVQEPS